jgi:hypothetical protein
VYLVLLAAAVAILTGVVAVAMGWGGEMVASHRDLPAVPLRASTAYDVAMLRLPSSLFGYQRDATDAALHEISRLVANRDGEIAHLREELWRFAEALRSGQPAALAAAAVPAALEAAIPAAEAALPTPADAAEDGVPATAEPASAVADEILPGSSQATAQPSPPS